MEMENGKKKILIIAIISCVLLLLVGGYFVVTKVILNNNETETNKETITLEVGVSTSLSQYIENIDEVENAVFEKTDIFSINAEYLITTLKEGTDSLVVTYTDGTNEILTFKAVEVKEVTIGLTEKVYLGDYVENLENIKSTSFTEEDIFTLENNYIVANHAGISELEITYKDNSTGKIRLYCNVGRIELEVGQTVNLSDYVEDIAAVSSVAVNDPSVFLIENNTVKALAEGSTILTVTYNDGTTELFDLNCLVKTSNAATVKKIKVILGKDTDAKSYYIYALEKDVKKCAISSKNDIQECRKYHFYSDAALTKRIFQIDLGYTTNWNPAENGQLYKGCAGIGGYKACPDEFDKNTNVYQGLGFDRYNSNLHLAEVSQQLYELSSCTNYCIANSNGYVVDARGVINHSYYYKGIRDNEVWRTNYFEPIAGYKITLDAQNYSPIKDVLAFNKKTNGQVVVWDYTKPLTEAYNYLKYVKVPTKTGYKFGGYYTKANGQGTQIINSEGKILDFGVEQLYSARSNVTLYAKWTRNSNGYRGY